MEVSASVLPIPQASLHDILSESVPTAFPPDDMSEDDFSLSWEGPRIEGVQFSLEKGSIQWARINEVLVLPRARLMVEAKNFESGIVNYAGFITPLSRGVEENGIQTRLVVALISGEKNPIDIQLIRSGQLIQGRLLVKFSPKNTSAQSRIYRDPSCSRFGLAVDAKKTLQQDEWIYFGCRSTVAGASDTRVSTLEIYVYWDNVGREIEVEGLKTPSSLISTWAMKVGPEPGVIHLASDQNSLEVRYSLPKRLHFGSLSVGIGPYSNSFHALGNSVLDARPLVTLYGSYFISEGIRFVGFNATSIGSFGYNDLGFYMHSENFKILDRRLSINLLLGGHVIGFFAGGSAYMLFGIPQGIEMIFSDFIQRGMNLSLGGFVYPKIDGKAYNNVWLRWGTRNFIELNYILWEEVVRNEPVFSRNLGITLGFPLSQFF